MSAPKPKPPPKAMPGFESKLRPPLLANDEAEDLRISDARKSRLGGGQTLLGGGAPR